MEDKDDTTTEQEDNDDRPGQVQKRDDGADSTRDDWAIDRDGGGFDALPNGGINQAAFRHRQRGRCGLI